MLLEAAGYGRAVAQTEEAAGSEEEVDMPFYNEHNDASNFVISWTRAPKNDFGIFAKGYKLAAERLTTLLLGAPRFSDYEAYPAVFLYRHALELSLKHVIYRSAMLAAYRDIDDLDDKLHNNHDLRSLARTASASLALLFPDDELVLTFIPVVEETCVELAEIDPDSYSYRYPIDRKGRPSTRRHQLVNLTDFANRLSYVLDNLDTIYFGLNAEIDVAADSYYQTVLSKLEE